MKIFNCHHCNRLTSRKKYCSLECNNLSIRKKTNSKVETGTVKNSESLRKYLAEKFGYKCSVCEISDWNSSPLMLQVDHIDGNPDNNFPNNLRLMCPNCHSQTPTYKGGNKKTPKNDSRSILHRKIYRESKNSN